MIFFWDENINCNITYSDILIHLESGEPVAINLYKNSIDKFFLNLIKAICNNIDITILDLDFSMDEVEKLILSKYSEEYSFCKPIRLSSYSDLNDLILNSESLITLFTSGTSGQPKKIIHPIKNLTRDVRVGNRYKNNIWGFAYNPTHIAGLQVFFQAILNQNSLINLFRKNKNEINYLIEKFKITHISATPTFYRLLLPKIKSHLSITNISLGGEKSETKIIEQLKDLFPNARINNIYASTEVGTLFSSNGEVFQIPETKRQWIKVENNELIIHKNLLGTSESVLLENDWYKTGDEVEWIDEFQFSFKFKRRKNELLNIGGNKVNPDEVEEYIKGIDGVLDAYVYGKSNSILGTLLCCDIVILNDITESKIRNILTSKLQDYKIPRKFYFKDTLELNRAGKIKRTNNG